MFSKQPHHQTERQEKIADLARIILPVMEQYEQASRRVKFVLLVLLLALTAFAGWQYAEHHRPLSSAEESTLRMLLNASAAKHATTSDMETQALLNRLHVERLSDIRAHQWNEALRAVGEE